MQSPTAAPMIPASASGVSKQRSGPKVSRNPAVARKTPPARPTSSPSTITSGSRPSSTWKQSLIASTSVSSATAQLPQVVLERGQRIDVGVLEHERHIGGRLGLRLGDARPHQLRSLRANLLRGRLVEDTEPPEVALVAPDALVLALLLDPLRIDVCARVVG